MKIKYETTCGTKRTSSRRAFNQWYEAMEAHGWRPESPSDFHGTTLIDGMLFYDAYTGTHRIPSEFFNLFVALNVNPNKLMALMSEEGT